MLMMAQKSRNRNIKTNNMENFKYLLWERKAKSELEKIYAQSSSQIEYLLKTKRTKSELENIFVQLNIKASVRKYNCLCKFNMIDLIRENIMGIKAQDISDEDLHFRREFFYKLTHYTNFQLYILLRLVVKSWVISTDLGETDYEKSYN